MKRTLLATALALCAASAAVANHPVLVEGEQDYDGDGLIGAAEDIDNATDRVFGTINAALGAANGAANQNGRVTIVTSGRFPEVVTITGANGNVTLEAAPGVEANIDAVLAGAAGNAERQNSPGIIIDAPASRHITLRNLVIRNWTEGIRVVGDSRVLIDNCRIEQNVNYGIRVLGNARVVILNSQIAGTGFRVGATGNFPAVDTPAPGIGIEFEEASSGAVISTTVAGSFAAGLANSTGNARAVQTRDVSLFDNAPNLEGAVVPLKPKL